MKQRAQVSVEFIMIIAIVTLAFIVGIALIFDFIGQTVDSKENKGLQDVGEVIMREVTTAKTVDDNYQKVFELPATIEGSPYNVTLNKYNPPNTMYSEVVLTFYGDQGELPYEKVVFLYNVNVASIGPGRNVIKKEGGLFYVCNLDTIETCDGLDNDCDDQIDEGCDTDQDGYIDATMGCDPEANMIYCADDNGLEGTLANPCTRACSPVDCNDNNANIHPSFTDLTSGFDEICDGLDNDCDGLTDEGCDTDQDGYIDAEMTCSGTPKCADDIGVDNTEGCSGCGMDYLDCADNPSQVSGSDFSGNDCSDIDCDTIEDASCGFCVNPGAFERQDGIDNDCDDGEAGNIDNDPETGIDEAITTMYCDYDGDGHRAAYPVQSPLPSGCIDYPVDTSDCDDTRDYLSPSYVDPDTGFTERCDGFDNDCDGRIDEFCDTDGDNYVNASMTCNATELSPACATDACIGGCSKPDCDDAEPADIYCPDLNYVSCTGLDFSTSQHACQAGDCVDTGIPLTGSCDDGAICSGDTCTDGVGCEHDYSACDCDGFSPYTCEDRICQTESCGPDSAYSCAWTNDDTLTDCDSQDGYYCSGTTLEYRDYYCSAGACAFDATTALACEDGVACSIDTCDATGIVATNVSLACSKDTSGCQCDTIEGCNDMDEQCKDYYCDLGSYSCVSQNINEGLSCNDGNSCTLSDVCSSGSCGGTQMDCSSNNRAASTYCSGINRCTASAFTSSCSSGSCTTAPGASCSSCDFGEYCRINEACSGGTCVSDARSCASPRSSCSESKDMCCIPSGAHCQWVWGGDLNCQYCCTSGVYQMFGSYCS